MNASRALKLAFGALLILTLGLKLWSRMSEPVPEQAAMVRKEMAAFLAEQGFKPEPAAEDENPVSVSGTSDACTLRIVDIAPQGWHRDMLRQIASPGDRVVFVYRGSIYEDQPVWTTRLSAYWAKALRSLGLGARVEPVLGITASPACHLCGLPWALLAEKIAAIER
ncbi:MAG TPA: hypothetical protein VFG05_08400 [Methylocella sp.]|nr:hypothetical protein [Methylocella sp.]